MGRFFFTAQSRRRDSTSNGFPPIIVPLFSSRERHLQVFSSRKISKYFFAWVRSANSDKLIEHCSLSLTLSSPSFSFSNAYPITNQNRMRAKQMRIFSIGSLFFSFSPPPLFAKCNERQRERERWSSQHDRVLVCIWRVRRSYAAIQEMSRENRTIKCNLLRCRWIDTK